MADYKTTSAKLSVVEASDADAVPFKQGQLIIEDSGNCYYDLSNKTNKAEGRKSLTSISDLTQYIKRTELLGQIQSLYGSIASDDTNPVSGDMVYRAIQQATSSTAQPPWATVSDIDGNTLESGIYTVYRYNVAESVCTSIVIEGNNSASYSYSDSPETVQRGLLIRNSTEHQTIITADGVIYHSLTTLSYENWSKRWVKHMNGLVDQEGPIDVDVSLKSGVTGGSIQIKPEKIKTVRYVLNDNVNVSYYLAASDNPGCMRIFFIKVAGNNVSVSISATGYISGVIPKFESGKEYMVIMWGIYYVEVKEVTGKPLIADDVTYST